MDCYSKIKSKLNQYEKNIRFVDKIEIENKKYIIKKEIINKKKMLEYSFYKNNFDLIYKYNFNYFINLPIKILLCKQSYIYIFTFI